MGHFLSWWLVFLIPVGCPAADFSYSAADLARRKATLTELSKDLAYAESELPPCAGLEYMENELNGHAPPGKSCPKAASFRAYVQELAHRQSTTCRELTDWLPGLLANRSLCQNEESLSQARKKSAALRIQAQGRDWGEENPDDPRELAVEDFDDEHPRGELRKMDCALGVTIGMQFRRRILMLGMKHFGKADTALDSACRPSNPAEIPYEDYVRYGEKAEERRP